MSRPDTRRTGALSDERKLSLLAETRSYLGEQVDEVVSDAPMVTGGVPSESSDPGVLTEYATKTIPARLVNFAAYTYANTYHLCGMYLMGEEDLNPLCLVNAARSQLEVYSVAAFIRRTCEANQGMASETFSTRVHTVDDALIQAIYGLPLDDWKVRLHPGRAVQGPSATAPPDGTNLRLHVHQMDETGEYPGCEEAYFRLCEFVHPNIGQSLMFLQVPRTGERAIISARDERAMSAASAVSLAVMATATDGTIQTVNRLEPPFGRGT